jgi:DNA-binding Lrp family transcriptional regulator
VQLSARSLLRVFSPNEWAGLGGVLSPDQISLLDTPDSESFARYPDSEAGYGWEKPLKLQPVDEVLLAELAFDGRVSAAALAGATKWHESVVRRRIGELTRSGVLYFDVDVETEVLGLWTSAMLWLSVEPSQLELGGQRVASHPEVPFVAATTGPTNLLATVHCRSPEHLYNYLTGRLQTVPGVTAVETTPLIRTLKRSGSLRPPP